MPKFYVARTEEKGPMVRGSMDDIRAAIREESTPGRVWEVSAYDFPFTKETICALVEDCQKPVATTRYRLNDKGQVREVVAP